MSVHAFTAAPPGRRCGCLQPHSPRLEHGFTLVEVLVALLLATIGLLGTLAVQQTVMNATQNANDAQVAMRLAQQTAEETMMLRTLPGPPVIDEMAPLADGLPHGMLDHTGGASVFLNAEGTPSPTATPAHRYERSITITNAGVGLPYIIAVEVRYALDSGRPRRVRLDLERRKNW